MIIVTETVTIESLEAKLEDAQNFLNAELRSLSTTDAPTLTDIEILMYHQQTVARITADIIEMAKTERSLLSKLRNRFANKK